MAPNRALQGYKHLAQTKAVGNFQDGCKSRDRKVENFPDSSIYRAKTFRTGKKCVNQIFAIKMCVNYNFAPKRWFNSRFICLSIWKPATKLSDSMF